MKIKTIGEGPGGDHTILGLLRLTEHVESGSQHLVELEHVAAGTGVGLALSAERTVALAVGRVLSTGPASVSELLGYVSGCLFGIDEPTGGTGLGLVLPDDALRLDELEERPLGILWVLGDTDLGLGFLELH